jgi:cyclophilin family peptidyl-prolyl cis-trans isomerase
MAGLLPEAGTYAFRVVVTDSEGTHATDFVIVRALPLVTATVPKLVVVGDPVVLSAAVDTQAGDATLLWEVTLGQASLSNPTSANPTLTIGAAGAVRLRLTATIPSTAGAPVTVKRDFEIASVLDLRPRVLIETNIGDMTIELDGDAAPLHTANFLLYVDDGFYAGVLFHRSACSPDAATGVCEPFVLQGGGYERVDGELEAVAPTRDPVPSEANNGLSNGVLYSVALALTSGDPDSGTTQFFINLSQDNSFLDNQGFTVFGQVVKGTDVIDAIAAMERTPSPIIPGEVSLPAEDVIMERVTRVSIVE